MPVVNVRQFSNMYMPRATSASSSLSIIGTGAHSELSKTGDATVRSRIARIFQAPASGDITKIGIRFGKGSSIGANPVLFEIWTVDGTTGKPNAILGGSGAYSHTFTTKTATAWANTGDTITCAGHGLANGTQICFTTAAPDGLSANTSYYILNATTDTFQVTATYGSSTVEAITADGSGSLQFFVSGFIEGTLSAAATVTKGTKYAVVVKTTSDEVDYRIDLNGIQNAANFPFGSYYQPSGSTWTNTGTNTHFFFTLCYGSTYYFVHDQPAACLVGTGTFDNTTTPNEVGNKIVADVGYRVSGLWAVLDTNLDTTTATLYDSDGTTVKGTVVFDKDDGSAAGGLFTGIFASPVDLVKGNTYYLAFSCSSTGSDNIYRWWEFNTAAMRVCMSDGGTLPTFVQRNTIGSGAFTETDTKIMIAGFTAEGINIPTGGEVSFGT